MTSISEDNESRMSIDNPISRRETQKSKTTLDDFFSGSNNSHHVISLIKENNKILKTLQENQTIMMKKHISNENNENKQDSHIKPFMDIGDLNSVSCIEDFCKIDNKFISLSVDSNEDETGPHHTLRCNHCTFYLKNASSLPKHLKLTPGTSFATSYNIPHDKFILYHQGMQGNEAQKRIWLNFRQSVVSHHSSLTHLSALDHLKSTKASERQSHQVTKNIVSLVIA